MADIDTAAVNGSSGAPVIDSPRRHGPLPWLRARLKGGWMETHSARTLLLEVPGWPGHRAGQHIDVRLTAEDGYSAQRSYSIASTDDPGHLQLTVQLVQNGDVSPYLVEAMEVGDDLEVRGPIGGWFTWTEDLPEPVLLVGGGSGIVPLMAMLRQRLRSHSSVPFHLLSSARTPDHQIYANEIYAAGANDSGVTTQLVYTRSAPPDSHRGAGRLTTDDVPAPGPSPSKPTRVFVCGPTGFVESAASLLLSRGHPSSAIRTEHFGPTGG